MPAAYVSHVGAAEKSAVDDSPARGLTVPMISRSASIVDRPLSSPRPPWLEKSIPYIPFYTASSASSGVRMAKRKRKRKRKRKENPQAESRRRKPQAMKRYHDP